MKEWRKRKLKEKEKGFMRFHKIFSESKGCCSVHSVLRYSFGLNDEELRKMQRSYTYIYKPADTLKFWEIQDLFLIYEGVKNR